MLKTVRPSRKLPMAGWVWAPSQGSALEEKALAQAGSYAANAWGLHDMLGNAWEWTEDCYNGSNGSYAGAPSDGSVWEDGGCTRRVLRGGSWFSSPIVPARRVPDRDRHRQPRRQQLRVPRGPEARPIRAFCDSPSYKEDPFFLLYALKSARRLLPGVVCLACESFLDHLASEARTVPGRARTAARKICSARRASRRRVRRRR